MSILRRDTSPGVWFTGVVCVLSFLAATNLYAQAATSDAGLGAGSAAAAPAPPVPPEVVAIDESGHVTIRASRVTEPIRVDGRIDDVAYAQVRAVTGLIQNMPKDGAPVSEKTEMWILYDDQNLYVTCKCWQESTPMVLDDMRRDASNNGDFFSVSFDTFFDHRNSYLFYMNPLGGIMDVLTSDERTRNESWNGVWDAKAGRFEGGWVAEAAIPFKTLRYRPGRDQVWGVILRRRIRNNGDEHAFLPRMPRAWGPGANIKMSGAGTLVGLEAPSPALNLEFKPYAITNVHTDLQSSPRLVNDPSVNGGFDLKYGITKSLSLDATYRTDFAQVEDDQAQVNLTRFSVFFPEKRDFFLEGQGLFAFGATMPSARGGAGRPNPSNNPSLVPVMFFSRRIGLQEGRLVPITGGARLMGQAGHYSVGVLSIGTEADATAGVRQTTFNVVRVKRDFLRRSTIGALLTRRPALAGGGSNVLYGLDTILAFYDSLNINGYLAKTDTPGLTGHDWSYRAQLDYDADRYGLQLERLTVADDFNPEVGFMRREDFRRNFGQARFSPRPRRDAVIRKFVYQGSLDYITDNKNTLETRNVQGLFRLEFQSSDSISVQYDRAYEFVKKAFTISQGVRIPTAAYKFANLQVSYNRGQQHRVSGTTTFQRGGFYGGDKTTASFQGRVKFGVRLAIEPTVSLDWIDLPQASLITKLVSTRGTYNFTPRMFVGALVQYSSTSSSFTTNIRYRWEYQPGGELFVVYTEGRDVLSISRLPLENRGFAVKLTRLLRL